MFTILACASEPKTVKSQNIEETNPALELFDAPVGALKEKLDTIPEDTVNIAKMKFEATEFDFGKVNKGTKVEHVFKFENVGKVPLTITGARSTCGCTVSEWPEEPVAVGAKNQIKVIFDTSNKRGRQEKSVMITANTYPAITKVKLKGKVVNPYIIK